MAQHRYTAHQVHDPFIALSSYHLQRLEERVHGHLAEQACHPEPRRTIITTVRGAWAWLRQWSGAQPTSRRRPA
jgi:hypothetical protein